jgi:hypothetical protein
MNYGDKGEQVKQVQQTLIASGYPLPKYGADGQLGDETWNALRAYAKDHKLTWTPPVPQGVIDALTVQERVDVYNLTSMQTNPPADQSKFKIGSNGKVVARAPATVHGVMLHQTDVWYGVSQAQIDAAGGDKHLALHKRSLNVACHLIAFDGQGASLDCGHAAWPNPLEWYVNQANTANDVSIGVECEGKYPGLVSPGCTMPTERLIQAARNAVKFVVDQGRAQGMVVEYIWAHRQSSAARRSDPGEALWKEVVLGYAVPVLGLKTETARTWGDGKPIPVEWDPNGVGPY